MTSHARRMPSFTHRTKMVAYELKKLVAKRAPIG